MSKGWPVKLIGMKCFYDLTPWNRLLEKLVLSQLVKKSRNFVKHECSFSSSLEPLFLCRARWMQMALPLPTNFRSILIIFGLQVFHFIHVSTPKLCVLYSSPPYVLYAFPKSSAMIRSPELNMTKGTNHQTLLYAGSFYCLSSFLEWNGQCNSSSGESGSALETALETVSLQLKQILQSR